MPTASINHAVWRGPTDRESVLTLCGREFGFHHRLGASTPTNWSLVTCTQCIAAMPEHKPKQAQPIEVTPRVEHDHHEAMWKLANDTQDITRAVRDAREIITRVLADTEEDSVLDHLCKNWLENFGS
jgi:hypothetical protein